MLPNKTGPIPQRGSALWDRSRRKFDILYQTVGAVPLNFNISVISYTIYKTGFRVLIIGLVCHFNYKTEMNNLVAL